MSKREKLMSILTTATAAKKMATTQDTWDPNLGVLQQGDKFIIPQGLSLDKAAKWLSRFAREQEEKQELNEYIDGHPLDVLVQLSQVMRDHFGWASSSGLTVQTMFGKQKQLPTMVTVTVGVDAAGQPITTDVPWGDIEMPGDVGYVQPGIHVDAHKLQFRLGGEIKKKALPFVRGLMNEVRARLKTHSIYKGKAFNIRFIDFDNERWSPTKAMPVFWNTRDTEPGNLIFRRDMEEALGTNLFAPIVHTDKCRAHGIALKRGILLEGDYGTGKTMTAEVLAKLCEDNGWTFINLEDTKQLHWAIEFAKRYSPAVIFGEDIDQVFPAGHLKSGEENLQRAITNSMDAVDGKHDETMIVTTTNHLDKLSRAILRPGRMDFILHMALPDSEAAGRLTRLYAGGALPDDEDISAAMEIMSGSTPSHIAECVKRSSLADIALGGDGKKVTGDSLRIAASSMQQHRQIILDAADGPKETLEEKVAHIHRDGHVEAAKIRVEGDVKVNSKDGSNGAAEKPAPQIAAPVETKQIEEVSPAAE